MQQKIQRQLLRRKQQNPQHVSQSICSFFSSFVANLSIYSNEDVVPILTKYDSTLYNFGVEITQKKLDYDHTNIILVSALCNYIPMWVWIKSRFLFNSQRNLTCHIITVLMFALLVKVNSDLYWQASTQCVELDAQEIKASSSGQNWRRNVRPKAWFKLFTTLKFKASTLSGINNAASPSSWRLWAVVTLSSWIGINDGFKLN